MNRDVRDRFNAVAPEYEDTRRKFIPDFDTFYGAGIQFLDCEKPDPRVLDLGAGTGLYTHKLLTRYPQARVTLVDFAGDMLDIARRAFHENPRIRFVQADYGAADFAGETFDIVISALSIHHEGEEGKRKIYEKVYALLNPGGEFLNADQVAAGTAALDQKYREIHAAFVKAHASGPEYAQFLQNITLDRRTPVSPQLAWLQSAGFIQADCIFKLGCFAVMYGKK